MPFKVHGSYWESFEFFGHRQVRRRKGQSCRYGFRINDDEFMRLCPISYIIWDHYRYVLRLALDSVNKLK